VSRPRKKNTHLPPCVYLVHGAYWYVKRGAWKHLAPEEDLAGALSIYADLVQKPKLGGMPKLIETALPVICRGLAQSTRDQYEVAGRKLSKALERFEPQQVEPKDLAAIKRAMAAKPNMANRVLTVARLIFSYALEEQLVSMNPAVGIKRHKERHRDRCPEQAEYDAVYAKAGDRLRVVMELLRYGGQRTVDTLRIRKADVLDAGIRFRQQKTDAFLIVKWTQGLRAAVEAAGALEGPVVRSLFLLPSKKRGKAPDYRSVREQWDLACQGAGVENLHLHDLRAMSATRAEEEGKNPTALLGHTNAQQTRRYLRGRKAKLVEGPEF
jgi:integrase